jgi:hypothetical protein
MTIAQECFLPRRRIQLEGEFFLQEVRGRYRVSLADPEEKCIPQSVVWSAPDGVFADRGGLPLVVDYLWPPLEREFTRSDVIDLLEGAFGKVRTDRLQAKRKIEELNQRPDSLDALAFSLDFEYLRYNIAANNIEKRRTWREATRDGVTRLRRQLQKDPDFTRRYQSLRSLEEIEAAYLNEPPLPLESPWYACAEAFAGAYVKIFYWKQLIKRMRRIVDEQTRLPNFVLSHWEIFHKSLPPWTRDGFAVCFVEAALRRIGADPPSRRTIEGVIRELLPPG